MKTIQITDEMYQTLMTLAKSETYYERAIRQTMENCGLDRDEAIDNVEDSWEDIIENQCDGNVLEGFELGEEEGKIELARKILKNI